MITLQPGEHDDRDFLEIVGQILNVGVSLVEPQRVFIVKIDSWFDHKWLEFSHRSLGAIAWANKELRIPPFIPDRIIGHLYFKKIGSEYEPAKSYPLHIYQPSEENRFRKPSVLSESTVFVWFSSETIKNSQASLMVYVVSKDFQKSWYVSFIKKSGWQIFKTKNTSKADVKAMLENDYLALIR